MFGTLLKPSSNDQGTRVLLDHSSSLFDGFRVDIGQSGRPRIVAGKKYSDFVMEIRPEPISASRTRPTSPGTRRIR